MPSTSRLLLFGREELPPQFSPLPELFERSHARPRRRPGDPARAHRPDDPGRLPRESQRTRDLPRRQRPFRTPLARRRTRSTRRSRASRPIAALERREVVIDGLPFYEVVSVTRIEAGIADNVVPDRAVATLNFRYPPDRTPDEAEAYPPLARPDGADESRSRGDSPPGRGRRRRTARPGAARRPAISPSSRSRRGRTSPTSRRAAIAAVNFGPGATRYAHRRDEQVEIAALVRAYGA